VFVILRDCTLVCGIPSLTHESYLAFYKKAE
jgi:hypothetical protein